MDREATRLTLPAAAGGLYVDESRKEREAVTFPAEKTFYSEKVPDEMQD